MLEKFNYINHIGETLEFGKDCLFVNENDLRDFAWEITERNNKISGFKKGIVQKTIPVILKCSTEADGVSLKNRMFEVFEKDVLAKRHGKIVIGDYYLRCYVTGSKKSEYLIHKNYMVVSLTVQTDLPDWVKETVINQHMDSVTTDAYLDYNYDFPYDFKNGLMGGSISNPNFVASNFIMTFYGAVSNPTVFIGGHMYSVAVTIGNGEYLTIDSVNKTIVLTKQNGEQVNCFNERNKDSYIFEKIPSGVSEVTSAHGQIQFDVALLEERSEPKWT